MSGPDTLFAYCDVCQTLYLGCAGGEILLCGCSSERNECRIQHAEQVKVGEPVEAARTRYGYLIPQERPDRGNV